MLVILTTISIPKAVITFAELFLGHTVGEVPAFSCDLCASHSTDQVLARVGPGQQVTSFLVRVEDSFREGLPFGKAPSISLEVSIQTASLIIPLKRCYQWGWEEWKCVKMFLLNSPRHGDPALIFFGFVSSFLMKHLHPAKSQI